MLLAGNHRWSQSQMTPSASAMNSTIASGDGELHAAWPSSMMAPVYGQSP